MTQNLAVRIILSRSKIPLASGRASSSSRLSWMLQGACLISLPSLMGPECASLVGTQIKAGGDLQLGVFFLKFRTGVFKEAKANFPGMLIRSVCPRSCTETLQGD